MQDAETPPAPELPPLAGEERELVEKHPMPKGVPDAEVNKNLLGAALDVSTTTIDKWLVLPEAERIPFVERGTNGRSYVFRLSVAYAWRMARDAQDAANRQHAEDASTQLRMELLGGSIQDLGRAALSPKEQEQALKVEKNGYSPPPRAGTSCAPTMWPRLLKSPLLPFGMGWTPRRTDWPAN